MNQTATPTIHVYAVTETEWFAAANPSDAVDAYREHAKQCFGQHSTEGEEILADWGEPLEIDDAGMLRLRYQEDDGTSRTFREQLDLMIAAGESFPCLFACSEF